MPAPPHDDRVYYEVGNSLPLAHRVSLFARRRMFDLFMTAMEPNETSTILDIGTSDEETEEANILEKSYPWPSRITCASLGSGGKIVSSHPDVRHITITAGEQLPFRDQEFDVSYSNAVLEHVGGPDQRRSFLLEAMRVSRSVFMLVPNRWFPIEHHTGIPFLHWWPSFFRSAFAGGRQDYWTKRSNLDFLSIGLLQAEWPVPRSVSFKYTGLRLGPFSSNVALISR